MLLLVSMILAVLPLAGIAALLWVNPYLTVDNLFTSLILLTISGVFGLNVLIELRQRGRPLLGKKAAAGAGSSAHSKIGLMPGKVKEKGVVEHVAYFESGIGHTNRSVVTLRNGAAPKLLVFKGDVRDQFPLGRRVEVFYSEDKEGSDLLERKLA